MPVKVDFDELPDLMGRQFDGYNPPLPPPPVKEKREKKPYVPRRIRRQIRAEKEEMEEKLRLDRLAKYGTNGKGEIDIGDEAVWLTGLDIGGR